MTIYVPSDAALQLPGTPVSGTVDEIDEICGFLRGVSENLIRHLGELINAHAILSRPSSEAVVRVGARLSERIIPGADSMHGASDAAQAAFSAYAAEVDRIHLAADRITGRVQESLGIIADQSAVIDDIARRIRVPAPYFWDIGAPGEMPEPGLGASGPAYDTGEHDAAVQFLRSVHESQWMTAAAQWHAAIEEIRTAKKEWSALIEERRDAEERLMRVLRDTSIGQLISLSADDSAALRSTIAVGITGELRGVTATTLDVVTTHPLLTKLIGTASGARIWHDPPDPAVIAAKWSMLSADERRTLISEAPWVLGNLAGLPFAVRDAANRRMIARYQQHPGSLSAEQLQLLSEVRSILRLEALQTASSPDGTADPPVQIIALDVTGRVPMVAVGYGDVDTADHVTWQVAGMNSDASHALRGWDAASRNLLRAQSGYLGHSEGSAVVAWLGYDTPDSPVTGDLGVLGSRAAASGAVRFAAEVDGASAARGAGTQGMPRTHVLAHSYGTTLATIALSGADGRSTVESVTLLGSAGLDTDAVPSLDALRVEEISPGQSAVFTTHAWRDQLAPIGAGLSGRGQPNPGAWDPLGLFLRSPVYEGSLRFSAEGDAARGLEPTDGHSTIGEGKRPGLFGLSASEGRGYLDLRTEALDSVAQITTERVSEDLARSLIRTGPRNVAFGRVAGSPSAVPFSPPISMERETLRTGGSG